MIGKGAEVDVLSDGSDILVPGICEHIEKACVNPVSYTHLAVSVGENGEKLTDMHALKEAGCCAFSDDGVPVKTAELMREALKEAARLDMPVFAPVSYTHLDVYKRQSPVFMRAEDTHVVCK